MVPEYSNPAGVFTPQASYHQVARVGDLLFVSGQIALDPHGEAVGIGDAYAQGVQVWANLKAICEAYGVGLRNIAKITTYITDRAYRTPVSQARADALGDLPSPASTLVIIDGLAEPHFLVEIEAVVSLG